MIKKYDYLIVGFGLFWATFIKLLDKMPLFYGKYYKLKIFLQRIADFSCKNRRFFVSLQRFLK